MSIIIEPTKITRYCRTDAELQAFWIFCIVVAGKSSKAAAAAVNKMFKYVDKPFVFLRALTNKERLVLGGSKYGIPVFFILTQIRMFSCFILLF
jgi:hypothetical protein